MSPSEETIEDLFRAYEAAIVSALDPDHGWVDPALACLERGRSAVVMTAWNPGFERPSIEVNRSANDRLRRTLDEHGCDLWRADGFDPQMSMSEEGFLAWEMDVELACQIGRQFGQFAIYAYDRDGVRRVVAC
jgi:hypothetical protein